MKDSIENKHGLKQCEVNRTINRPISTNKQKHLWKRMTGYQWSKFGFYVAGITQWKNVSHSASNHVCLPAKGEVVWFYLVSFKLCF